MSEAVNFGLIVIGDELLTGARSDAHLPAFKRLIGERGHSLGWYWLLPDDPEVLTAHLRLSMARQEPVFVCGGIGATPDDHTRACAAAAVGSPWCDIQRRRVSSRGVLARRPIPIVS